MYQLVNGQRREVEFPIMMNAFTREDYVPAQNKTMIYVAMAAAVATLMVIMYVLYHKYHKNK